MRSRKITIGIMVSMVFCLGLPEAQATVVFNDGGTHTVDFTLNDYVNVQNSPLGEPTTLNIVTGGWLRYYLNVYDSRLNMSGGKIDEYLDAYGSSQVIISGGSIRTWLDVRNSSQVSISGGSIGTDLGARESSQVSISGGSIGKTLFTQNYSHVNISGGSIGGNLEANNNSQISISGGSIGGNLEAHNNSQISISGGSIGSNLLAYDYGQITIEGSGFNYPYGNITGSGLLTGTLANGNPIFNYFVVSGNGRIVLIPKPTRLVPSEYATIQAAIDDCNYRDTVVVSPGTYTGDGNRDLDFKGKAITVRSTDPNDPNIVAATIIDCNGTKEYPHRGFYFHTGEDANSILEGFTITNGYGPNEPFGSSMYSAGGAIFCNNSGPTIRKCVIRNNYAGFWGGGLWCSNSRAVVADCTFKENESGDTGGGLYNRLGSITVTKCRFSGNSAVAGGGIYNVDGAPTVANSIFVGNLASLRGGAVRNNRVTATLMNCTFFNNQAPNGGAIHNIDSWGTITNCILWENPNTEIEGTAIVSYCDVIGGWPGKENIDTDPLFADVNEGDFHLRSQIGRWDPRTKSWVQDSATSRCIDAGDPNDPIGYEPNPNGDRINQGAYGGTAEASKSPYCAETLLSDLNHDCRVDFIDFAIFVSEWLECRIEPPEFCWQ